MLVCNSFNLLSSIISSRLGSFGNLSNPRQIEVKLSETKAETDKDGKTKSLISRTDRYKCAVTNDILRNTTTLFVLKPTGAYQ